MSEAKRLRSLEDENAKLKRLLAEAMLDIAVLKDISAKMVTPDAKRDAVDHALEEFGLSERRACRVIGTDRTSVRCRATRDDDGVLCARPTALAQERRRFGYRRMHVLLRREGHAVNNKRVQRLYREEWLRKTAAIRMAEAGATNAEIKAWTGHKTDSEVARDIKAANKARLADAAAAKMANLETGLAESDRK